MENKTNITEEGENVDQTDISTYAPTQETENRTVGNKKATTEKGRTNRQMDIRKAMKNQEKSIRYTNRQRIQPTVIRPVDKAGEKLQGDIEEKNQIHILQNNQQKKIIANTHLILQAEENYKKDQKWIYIIQEPRVVRGIVQCKTRNSDTLYKKGGEKTQGHV